MPLAFSSMAILISLCVPLPSFLPFCVMPYVSTEAIGDSKCLEKSMASPTNWPLFLSKNERVFAFVFSIVNTSALSLPELLSDASSILWPREPENGVIFPSCMPWSFFYSPNFAVNLALPITVLHLTNYNRLSSSALGSASFFSVSSCPSSSSWLSYCISVSFEFSSLWILLELSSLVKRRNFTYLSSPVSSPMKRVNSDLSDFWGVAL